MASNLERFSGYIGGKVKGAASDFAAGAKASVYSANPAMFGGIESGVTGLKNEFMRARSGDEKRARQERAQKNRERGFQEEQRNEQRYADEQQQKIFKSMDDKLEQILKALLKGKDGGDSLLGGLPLLGLGFKGPGKTPPRVPGVDGKTPPRVSGVDGKKPPKIVDPELKKIRLRGLGFFDDIVKSFEKMKTSLFKTSIKFPELERYATSMADDMGKSVKAIGDMSDSIKASRESLLAKFGPQFGKGGKALSGAALDSRLGKLAGEADNLPKLMELPGEGKAAGAAADAAKGADAAGDASKFKNILNMDVGKLFGDMNGKLMKLLEGPLKFIASLTDVGPLIKGIGKVAGPLGVLIGIYDGLMNALDTEQLQETLGKTDITIGDRFAGFIGGFIGSIGGLFDLLLGVMGIQYEGESIQDFLTNGITKLASFSFEAIGDYFKLVGAYFEGIYGLVTGDQERIQNSKDKFEYLGEKWFGWTDDFGRIVGGMIANSIEDIKLSLNIMKESVVGIFDGLMLEISIVGDELAKKGNEIWNGGRVLIARAVNGIVDGVRWAVNWVIDAMNSITESVINAVPDSIFGVNLRQQKSSAKQALKINRLEKTSDVIDEEAIQKEHQEQQAALDASIAAKKGAKEALATKTLANIEQLETVSAETKLQMASANNAAQAERDAEAAARQEELGIKTGFIDDPALAEKPPEEQPPTKGDTTEQTDAITTATTDVGHIINDGNVEAMDNAAELSEAERLQQEALAVANADHQANLNSEMQRAYHVGVDRMLAGQSELMRSLVGPLLKGQGGEEGGFLSKLFGGGKEGGFFSKFGDSLGSFFGKGTGGWFDKTTGFFDGAKDLFGGIKDTFGSISGAFDELLGGGGSGTNILKTAGFGGSFNTGDPLANLLGGKLSEELGLSGVGTNAVAGTLKNIVGGMGVGNSFRSALAGPGGLAGGLGAALTIGSADINTVGGALSGGLGIYQLLKGGGLASMLGGGISQLGAKMTAQAAANFMAANAGPYSLAYAGKQGMLGAAGNALGNFGAGMADPTALFGNGGMATKLGAGAGAAASGFMAKGVGDFVSGGYTLNKHLTTAGGLLAGIGATGALGPLLAAGPAGIVIGVVAGLANRLFGRKAKEYTDVGLDLNMGTDTSGQVYKDWIKKGGTYRSDKKGTEYEALDSELVSYLNDSAGTIQSSYGKLAETMGLSAGAIVGFTKSYKISLEGLSGPEQQKKIAEFVQKYADDAIKSSYGNVSKFALEGEKTTDTFVRMASATENVAYWFDALGYTAEKTNDMFNKMAENDGLFSAGNGMFNFNFEDTPFYKNMISQIGGEAGASALDYEFAGGRGGPNGYGIDIYSLMNARAMAAAASAGATPVEPTEEQKKLAIAGAKANFVEMLGGQQMFGKTMQGYFSTFYSKEEQAEFMARQATIQAKAALDAVEAELESLSDQFSEIDPNVAESLDNIKSQKEVDEAKENYRKAIESAMESGDMALAAELLKSSEVFMQAANLQLQAAEMNGNATKEQVDLFSDMSEFGSGGGGVEQMKDTRTLNEIEETALGQIVGGGLTSNNVSAGEFDANVGSGVAALAAEGVVEVMNNNSGTGSADNLVVGGTAVENQNVISSNPAIIGSNNMTSNDVINNVNIANVGVRDFNPMLAVNVRGITMGHIGIGSM